MVITWNWDEEQLQYEIKERIEREKAKKPTDYFG